MMEPRGWSQISVSAVGEGGGSSGGSGSAWDLMFVLLGGSLYMLASEEIPGGGQSANETEGTRGGIAGVVSPVMVG